MYRKLTPGQFSPLSALVEHYKNARKNDPDKEPVYALSPYVVSSGVNRDIVNFEDFGEVITQTSREVLNVLERGNYITPFVEVAESTIPASRYKGEVVIGERVHKREFYSFVLNPEAIEYAELMEKNTIGQWFVITKKGLSEDVRNLIWTVAGGVLILLLAAALLYVLGLPSPP